jgi:acyl-CoA thioesterase-1
MKITGLRLFAVLAIGICTAACNAETTDIRIVALGTSFTAGKGVGYGDAFPAKLEKLLNAAGEHVQISNQGMNGDTTLGLLARLANAVPAGTQIVILEYALGNDRRRGIGTEATVKNCDDIVSKLVARNIQVLLVMRGAGPHEVAKRAEWFHETISRYGISSIGIEQPDSTLQSDGQHPTAAAHADIAASMAGPVTALIEKAKTTGR